MHAPHSRAAQATALIAALTVVTMSLPALAQTDTTPVAPATLESQIDLQYANVIVSTYRRAGDIHSYDNRSIENNAFDYPAFLSDTCFRPTPHDMEDCQYKYGPYANLKDTLDNGTLRKILQYYGLVTEAQSTTVAKVSNEISAQEQKAALEKEQESVAQINYDERVATLWRECRKMSSTENERQSCYQRNIRLIQRTNVEVIGNVH